VIQVVIFIVDLNHDLNGFRSMTSITWFKSHQTWCNEHKMFRQT